MNRFLALSVTTFLISFSVFANDISNCEEINKKMFPEEYEICKERGGLINNVEIASIELKCADKHKNKKSKRYESCVKDGVKGYISSEFENSKCNGIDKKKNPEKYKECVSLEFTENRVAFIENKCSRTHGGRDSLEYENCVKTGVKDFVLSDVSKSSCREINRKTHPEKYSECKNKEFFENHITFIKNKCAKTYKDKTSEEFNKCVKEQADGLAKKPTVRGVASKKSASQNSSIAR